MNTNKITLPIYFLLKKINARLSYMYYNKIFKMKLFVLCVTQGNGIKTYNGIPKIIFDDKNSKLIIGNNVKFNNYFNTSWYSKCRIRVGEGAKLTIGDNSGFNGVLIHCTKSIAIGNYVNVGGGTRIYDSNYHDIDWRGRRDPKSGKGTICAPVIIEEDVFIGTNCIIGKGVTIGARSVIAAGSVVVKDIPADCIAGGNPCKVIKSLV